MESTQLIDFQAGQVWQYETREGEESSLAYIVKIDKEEEYGKIYHIYANNLSIKNPYVDSGIQSELLHAPVDEQTLTQSLTKLVDENDSMPNISDGYSTWRESFDKGEAGVFNIPIKKIIQFIEEVVGDASNRR